MNMKFGKIFIILALTIFIMMPVFVSAAPSAGIKPSSIFYFLDIVSEKINLFFTFNPEKKARKALEYAGERLAEAEAAVTDNNINAVKTAMTGYESNVSFATEKSKDIGEKDKAEALLTTISDSTSKHQEVLTDILAKVPDEAKDAIMKAIEISRKGHEETLTKIAELKGEIEQLKQEVAELKKESNGPRADGVEKLKQEVEETKEKLKEKEKNLETSDNKNSEQVKQSEQKKEIDKSRYQEAERAKQEAERAETERLKNEQEIQRIATEQQRQAEERRETQRLVEQKQDEEAKRIANIKKVDEYLSQIVAAVKLKLGSFSSEKNDTNNFIVTIRNTMNKYPTFSLMQQSGQQLISESNNLSFILGKLIDIGNSIIGKANSLVGLGETSSELLSLASQFNDYTSQRDSSRSKVESLIATFVANEKTALDEALRNKQEELERKQRASQALNQLTVIAQEINNQLTILDTQIKAKETEIEAEYNRPVSMTQIERRVAQLTPELNALINQWNSLLDKKQKITTLNYKLNDYYRYGTSLSAEDRTFLLSLGISF